MKKQTREDMAIQYCQTLPDEIRHDVNALITAYRAYIAGGNDMIPKEDLDSFDSRYYKFRQEDVDKYEEIINIVCLYYNLKPDQIKVKRGKRELVLPRQLCMYFAKKYFKASITWKLVSQPFGFLHANSIHAVKTINNLIDTDKNIRQDVYNLSEKLSIKL